MRPDVPRVPVKIPGWSSAKIAGVQLSAFELLADPAPDAWRRFYGWWHDRGQPSGSFRETVPSLAINRWPGTGWEDDGKTVIYYEEQGVYLWALDGDADADPPVVGRYNEPGTRWRTQTPRLSTFYLQLLILEAAFSDIGVGTSEPTADGERALNALQPLPWPTWDWPQPGARFYAGADAVAFASEDDGWWSVWVGPRDSAARTLWAWMDNA